MKELDKTKAYDLSNLNDEELRELAEYFFNNKHEEQYKHFDSIEDAIDWIINSIKSNLFTYARYFNNEMWVFSNNSECDITDAKELFEEWTPKQGDTVRVTDERNKCIGVFVCTYKGHYLIDNKKGILIASKIKQIENEIKVGDWVKNPHAIYKVEINDDLDHINSTEGYFKITNTELIELLKQEFKTK